METNKTNWIEEVMGSLDGMEREPASEDLFERISTSIRNPNDRIIPIGYWRMAAAAAVLLLVINVFSIRVYNVQQGDPSGQTEVRTESRTYMFSDFNLYE